MSFVDELRKARTNPVTAYHEFQLDYQPGSGRIYAFFEGHDDRSFYLTFLQSYVADIRLVRAYKCGGKKRVYEVRGLVEKYHPAAERTLFFVDKDLSDVLGEVFPEDGRVFTTDYYAIENYLVCPAIVDRVIHELFRINNVTFDSDMILLKFERELLRFHVAVRATMAWITAARRASHHPIAANIRMADLFVINDNLSIAMKRRERVTYLEVAAQVPTGAISWRQVKAELPALRRARAKTYVRGKFEAWFLIEFLRQLEQQLRVLAKEAGGNITVKTLIHAENFVEVLAPRLLIPDSLREFLDQHLPSLAAS